MVLYHAFGMSLEDVAKKLGTNEEAVKQVVVRGRRAVRSVWDEDVPDDAPVTSFGSVWRRYSGVFLWSKTQAGG
jgi:hypothetical protein